jgi:hypothetical protein
MPVHYGSKELNFHTVSSPLSKINNFKLLFFFLIKLLLIEINFIKKIFFFFLIYFFVFTL